MSDEDETKIRKINISNKANVERKSDVAENGSSKKKTDISNRAVTYIFVFVAIFGYSAFYIWDKNFRQKSVAALPSKPKPTVKKKVNTEAKTEPKKEIVDLKSIILSPKCISKSDKAVCIELNRYRAYDGLEGAYSIATDLYIVVELKNAFKKLKGIKFNKDEEKKIITFVRSNMARQVNIYTFEKENFVYKNIKFNKKLNLATIVSDLKRAKLSSETIGQFDQIFLVGYLYAKSSVSQEIVVKESAKSFLKKMDELSLFELKMIFRSGFVDRFPYYGQGFAKL